MLFFHSFPKPGKLRPRTIVVKPVASITTLVGVSLTVFLLGIQADAKCKGKHGHCASASASMTPEQRETMATALEKKAKCLRSPEKSVSDCHDEMKASCGGGQSCGAQKEGDSYKCPMMEETK